MGDQQARAGKTNKMKLSDYLKSLIGQTITVEHTTNISTEVDNIKARAINKETEKYSKLKEEMKELEKEFKPLKEAQEKAAFEKEWADNKGAKDAKLENYNLDKFKGEDGKIDYKKLFEELPHLKAKDEQKSNEDFDDLDFDIDSANANNDNDFDDFDEEDI